MATVSTCATIFAGHDASCNPPTRKYYQQAVVINKTDIDPASITKTLPDYGTDTCNYKVGFTLLPGKTGYSFQGPTAGNNIWGRYSKSRSDFGHPQYLHETQILIDGVAEADKCILESLDRGSFVVGLQLTDGTVEIFGLDNGLNTGDYDYSIAENGGGGLILLSSQEDSPENNLPLVYEAGVPGQETADFDSLFAQP
jgi:hypothetical protein